MPQVAAPVMTFVAGIVGTGTVGAAVTAVSGAVAVGVTTGAVVGAASAAISGKNIFKGALKGAAIGGLTAGVGSGIGIVTGLAPAASQISAMGGIGGATAGAASTPTASAISGTADSWMSAGSNVAKPGILSTAGNAAAGAASIPGAPGEKSTGLLDKMFGGMSDEKAKILAGVGQGAFQGLGQVGAAKMEAENSKELAEWTQQKKDLEKANNIPGQFQAQVANIKIPDWWSKYLDPTAGTKAEVTA